MFLTVKRESQEHKQQKVITKRSGTKYVQLQTKGENWLSLCVSKQTEMYVKNIKGMEQQNSS